LLIGLGILFVIAFLISGQLSEDQSISYAYSWSLNALFILPFILVYFYRKLWQKKLVSLGHSGAEDTAIIKEGYGKKIQFCFKNEKYARSFAEMHNSKIE